MKVIRCNKQLDYTPKKQDNSKCKVVKAKKPSFKELLEEELDKHGEGIYHK